MDWQEVTRLHGAPRSVAGTESAIDAGTESAMSEQDRNKNLVPDSLFLSDTIVRGGGIKLCASGVWYLRARVSTR